MEHSENEEDESSVEWRREKVLQNQQLQQTTRLSDILYQKPFWIWDFNEHIKTNLETKGNCCFNHVVGLPKKEGIEKPIFDYQKLIYDYLLVKEVNNPLSYNFKHKHLWIKNATGLGVAEFFLRLMCWLCLRDNTYRGAQMCIVTGPNIDIEIKLIERMKSLFEQKQKVTFVNKEIVLKLNGCTI